MNNINKKKTGVKYPFFFLNPVHIANKKKNKPESVALQSVFTPNDNNWNTYSSI